MADGVDTAVDEVQAAVLDAPVDRARAQAQRPQLRVRYQAVLGRGELRERTVGVLAAIAGGLVAHTATKAPTSVSFAPGRRVAGGPSPHSGTNPPGLAGERRVLHFLK